MQYEIESDNSYVSTQTFSHILNLTGKIKLRTYSKNYIDAVAFYLLFIRSVFISTSERFP